jgi:hypothetical protein
MQTKTFSTLTVDEIALQLNSLQINVQELLQQRSLLLVRLGN